MVHGDGDDDARTRSSWKDLRRYYAGGGDCRAGIREREEEVFGRFEKLFEFVTVVEEDNGKVRKKNFGKNELTARERTREPPLFTYL